MKNINSSKDTIEKIHLISGNKKEDTKNFFEALAIYVIMNYYGKEEIYLPNIGKLYFTYIGDQIKNEKKKAKVELEFEPDDFLLRNIGQIEDGDEPDVSKFFISKIQSTLGEYLGDCLYEE